VEPPPEPSDISIPTASQVLADAHETASSRNVPDTA